MLCLKSWLPPGSLSLYKGMGGRNYAYVAGSSFWCFKSWLSVYKRTKAEALKEEQEQKIKLKRPEISLSLNQENKKRFQDWLN